MEKCNVEIGKAKGLELKFVYEDEIKIGEFKGEQDTTFMLPEKKIYYYGLGKKEEFEEDSLRKAGAKAFKSCSFIGEKNITIEYKKINNLEQDRFAYLITEGFTLSHFKVNYKSKDKSKEKEEKEQEEKEKNIKLFIDIENNQKNKNAINSAFIIADSQNYARNLINMPANIATPEKITEEAKKLAKELKLKIKVIDKNEMKKLGMNTILAVNSGSGKGAFLVDLHYKKGNKKEIALVGKGITFDSGGLQVKPGKYMLDMHMDKSGACAVLGIMRAIAKLSLNVNVRGILVLTENMIGENAYKPRDIIKSYSGKTIEVEHTDAEGRLILADGITYACEKKPEYIIDMATLTGAISVCLGDKAMGLFSNSKELSDVLKKAGNLEFERVWEFPMYKEYGKMMESEVADIRNVGSWDGEAGSILGAKFIEFFVDKKTKWAHLDIAGMDNAKDHPYLGNRGAGPSVRLLIKAIEML